MDNRSIIYEICDDNFEELVIKRSYESPVIVDFWAPWCGPCLALSPLLENIVKKLNGSVFLAKINVDRCREIAMQFGIVAIPTVLMFKNGRIVDYFIGLRDRKSIENWIYKHLY